MEAIVIGSGRMATAVAMSLLTQGSNVVLAVRDANAREEMRASKAFAHTLDGQSLPFPPPEASPTAADADAALARRRVSAAGAAPSFPQRRLGRVTGVIGLSDVASRVSVGRTSALFLCVPGGPAAAGCLETCVAPALAAAQQEQAAHEAGVVAEGRRTAAADGAFAAAQWRQTEAARRPHLPPLVLCCRGWSGGKGESAYRAAKRLLADVHRTPGDGVGARLPVPLLTLGGPFEPDDWTAASAAVFASKAARLTRQSDAAADAEDTTDDDFGAVVPVALTLAASPDTSLQTRGAVASLFAGESLLWLSDPPSSAPEFDACDAASVVDACALLVSFGAALVHSAHRGRASASAAYATHAAEATQSLLAGMCRGAVRSRCSGVFFPKAASYYAPPGLLSHVWHAAQPSPTAPAFGYGRRFFALPQPNAAKRAFYRGDGRGHLEALDAAADGLAAACAAVSGADAAKGGKSAGSVAAAAAAAAGVPIPPFFAATVDALRGARSAEDYARRIVCGSRCGWVRAEPPQSAWMSLVADLDKAVETGRGFEEAAHAVAHASHSISGRGAMALDLAAQRAMDEDAAAGRDLPPSR